MGYKLGCCSSYCFGLGFVSSLLACGLWRVFSEFCVVCWFGGFIGLVFLGWWILGLCGCLSGRLVSVLLLWRVWVATCGFGAWVWFEFGCVCSVVLCVGCLMLFEFRCLMNAVVWFYGCYQFVRVVIVADGGCCGLVVWCFEV